MAMWHNYITGAYTKPSSNEMDVAELVINQTDGTLWTKNPNGNVVQINSEREPLDTSWHLIGDTNEPYYMNGFTAHERSNLSTGIGYRFHDNKTLHVCGGLRRDSILFAGTYSIFRFSPNVTQRLVGLGTQYSVATCHSAIDSIPYLTFDIDGNFKITVRTSVGSTEQFFIDAYFQLN